MVVSNIKFEIWFLYINKVLLQYNLNANGYGMYYIIIYVSMQKNVELWYKYYIALCTKAKDRIFRRLI